MNSSKDLLVITASNGENLKLANRFVQIGETLNINAELLDFTTIDLPLYNPREHAKSGVPPLTKKLSQEISN